MTKFRFLFALVLVCGFCGAAKADPLDFNARIQDPPTSFPTYDITTSTFDVIFGASCPSDASDATGCFSGDNETGATITSIELIFPDTIGLDGQPVGCTTSEPLTLFATATCSLSPDNSTYTLDFSGGVGIAPGVLFTIAETGADPDAFGDGDYATATLSSVPEPGSVVLLGTGAAFVGVFLVGRRHEFFSI